MRATRPRWTASGRCALRLCASKPQPFRFTRASARAPTGPKKRGRVAAASRLGRDTISGDQLDEIGTPLGPSLGKDAVKVGFDRRLRDAEHVGDLCGAADLDDG